MNTAGVSIGRRVAELAAARGDEVVLTIVGADGALTDYTWEQLDDRSSRLAAALADRGLTAGDHLGLGLRNSAEFVLGALAAWKLGAIPVPSRWDLPDWELERLRAVIRAPVHLDDGEIDWIGATATFDRPDLDEAFAPHLHGICSSGSTGTPKVILSGRPGHFDDTLGVPFLEAWQPVIRPQRVLVMAPMYHANGFSALFYALAGDQLAIMERFDAGRTADAIEQLEITTFTATPTMLQRIADLPGIDDRDLSSLEWILQGAAPMPPSLVHRWAQLIDPSRLVMAYGMTEGLGLTALRGDEWMSHQGSVGRPFRDTELRILDDTGNDLPAGEVGEIYLRSSANGQYRYLGEAPNLPTTDDGFQSAGDVGYLDDDGYLYLLDRRVDIVITGGANVFPAEVEAALIDHPDIADVVVIGLPDPEWGHRVHAIVEPATTAPTADEVRAYAKERLAAYKVPKSVEVVDAIPRSAATKVNRQALVAERSTS